MRNRVEIISQEQRRAKVTMLLPIVGGEWFGGDAAKSFRGEVAKAFQGEASEKLAAIPSITGREIPESGANELMAKAGAESLGPGEGERFDGVDAAVGEHFDSVQALKPVESDYIYPVFRALSASVIPGYWLDYSRPGVLEESASMLQGQTVYKNHDFMDVEQWV